MKIALLIERLHPHGEGRERSTFQIARHLISRGHRVTVITGDAAPDFEIPGGAIHVGHTLDFKHRVKVSAFAKWAPRALEEGGYDTSISMTTACPASILQPRQGTVRELFDRVAASHAGTKKDLPRLLDFKRHARLRLEQWTLSHPSVRRIVAISPYVVRQLAEHYQVDAGRVTIVPNASDMPAVGDADRARFRRRVRGGFHVPDDAVVFLFAAHHPRLKGFDPLLRAMKELVNRGHAPVLLMAGNITHAQQELAATLGIRGHIRMVGLTNQMAELYCAADVTVSPTFYDPCGKVVIESLMMGVPAISTRYDGASDFLVSDDGRQRGRVIADPANVADLADAMQSLLDTNERNRCGGATAGLREALSMSRHVDQLEALL